MNIISQNIFTELECLYLEFVNPNEQFIRKQYIAKKIAEEIIIYFFNKNDRFKLFDSINDYRKDIIIVEKLKKIDYKQKPYNDNVNDKLKFLCDNEFIPLKYGPSLTFLRSNNINELEESSRSVKSIEFQLSLHEVVNQVLIWFLEENEIPKNYIIPIEFIENSNINSIHNNYIKNLLNIKTYEINLFKKYQTVITYLFVFIFTLVFINLYRFDYSINNYVFNILFILFFILILSISTISILNTFYYVKRSFLKIFRYIFFSLAILVVLYSIFSQFLINLNSHNGFDKNNNKQLDSDPNFSGKGFVFINSSHSKINEYWEYNPDIVDIKDLVEDENGIKRFYLVIHIKNLDYLQNDYIDSLHLNIYHSYIDDDLRFDVQVYGTTNSIFDIIRIKNFTPSKNSLVYFSPGKITYEVRRDEYTFQDSIVYSEKIVKDILLKDENVSKKSFNIPVSNKDIYKLKYSFPMGISPNRTIN